MGTVEFDVFDADNHYYEATDAFTRHLPASHKKLVQWAQIDGKARMVVAGKVFKFIPNPTFDPVARPGALDDYFRGKRAGDDIRAAFGALEPISAAYREPAARVALMDQQGMDGCFLFPTLGVGVEEALLHDPVAAMAAFHVFNEWMLDDWTFNYQDRIFAAPVHLAHRSRRGGARTRLGLAQGTHVVVMRSGPVRGPNFSRSPGDALYDPFWARVNESGILVAYHSGDSGYHRYAEDWGSHGEMEAFRYDPFRNLTGGHRPIHDTIAALICHGVFNRFPNVRVATIESGSDWVQLLARGLKKAYGQVPGAFGGADPVAQLRTNVWVSPYYEDDLRGLREELGAEHVIFGSDYPHAEGLADPKAFVDDLDGFSDAEIRMVMRDNALALSQPRP